MKHGAVTANRRKNIFVGGLLFLNLPFNHGSEVQNDRLYLQ
ncbi:MAG: hypothetical protein JWQ61_1745 [Collimonas fungivorans]|nr:hypothetical protein [Collimonas fungivorans]